VLRLLKRLELQGTQPSAEVLGPAEWWFADLARRLAIHPSKVRRWIRLDWVHSRRSAQRGRYIVWADGEELSRLSRLCAHARVHPHTAYPAELTVPRRPLAG
jgi:hypothetical protein